MSATARKNTPTSAKKAKSPRPPRRREDKIARVRKHADGVISVLANDPAFRQQLVEAMRLDPKLLRARDDEFEKRIEAVATKIGAVQSAIVQMNAVAAERARLADGEPSAEQSELWEELYGEMLKHGPLPPEVEMEAARVAWE